MENDYSGCESHNDCGGAEWPESVQITSYSASDPTYEHREPSTLQPERKYERKDRYADFMQPRHRSEGPGMTIPLVILRAFREIAWAAQPEVDAG
jgi:hypothetical protein